MAPKSQQQEIAFANAALIKKLEEHLDNIEVQRIERVTKEAQRIRAYN